MNRGFFLTVSLLLAVILVAPYCSERETPVKPTIELLQQVWEGEQYYKDGALNIGHRLYFKLSPEMTYDWDEQVKANSKIDSSRCFTETGTWELVETEDAIILSPDGGTPVTLPFAWDGDNLVVTYHGREWSLEWTFSSRSDWW